jgi:hypothetical protein
MSEMERDSIQIVLNKMMRGGHFDICVVDQILKITGGVPEKKDYDCLRLLHCVDFKNFTPLMRMEFPLMMERVITAPTMELSIKFLPQKPATILKIC